MKRKHSKASSFSRPKNSRGSKNKRFVFEFTGLQFFLISCLFCLGFFWMFGLGLTIGRGVPTGTTPSLWVKLAYMLGYKSTQVTKTKHASITWENPKDAKLSLTYYEALTKPPEVGSSKTQKQTKEEEMTPPPEKDLAKPQEGNFTVLVASFKNRRNAEQMERFLKSKGYQVSRQTVNIRGSTWYRVMIGNFKNRNDALKFVALFNKKEKQKAIVIHK